MRKPRLFRPGQLHDVTVRCLRSEFRLLPTEDRKKRLAFALVKAQQRCPGVQILALCQMSNHLHLCVLDEAGELSKFMQAFLSRFAKDINRLDKIRGAVFQRRFTALPVVDMNAFIGRIAYAITNPVDAGLVRTWDAWGGLIGWAEDFEPFTVTHFHEYRYKKACEASKEDEVIDKKDFEETVTLRLGNMEGLDGHIVRNAINERQKLVQRGHTRFAGMRRVLRYSPFHRPKRTKLSAMPLCIATCKKARAAFVREWFAFLAAFREASERFRAGQLDVVFPARSHRPSTPVH